MNILFQSALIRKAEEGGFWITFPDFPECMTQGEDIQDAYDLTGDDQTPIKKRFCYYQPERLPCKVEEHRYS